LGFLDEIQVIQAAQSLQPGVPTSECPAFDSEEKLMSASIVHTNCEVCSVPMTLKVYPNPEQHHDPIHMINRRCSKHQNAPIDQKRERFNVFHPVPANV